MKRKADTLRESLAGIIGSKEESRNRDYEISLPHDTMSKVGCKYMGAASSLLDIYASLLSSLLGVGQRCPHARISLGRHSA